MSRRVDATDPQFIRKLDYIPPHSVFLEAEKGLPAVAQTETDAEGHSIALTEAFYAHPIRQFSVIAAVTTYSTVAYRGADQPLDADLVEDDHRQQKGSSLDSIRSEGPTR